MANELNTSPRPDQNRRSFFAMLVGSVSVVVGAMMTIPALRFLLYPVLRATEGTDWFPVGDPSGFVGPGPFRREVEVRKLDGWRASTIKRTVWVVRNARNQLTIVSNVCPHLGCSVPWRDDENQFHCPCHHALFGRDAALISGPSPRSLDPLPTKVEGGQLWVKYQVFRNLVRSREVIG